jgi:hypothetical protein
MDEFGGAEMGGASLTLTRILIIEKWLSLDLCGME